MVPCGIVAAAGILERLPMPMSVRRALLALALLVALLQLRPAAAEVTCWPESPQSQICDAGILTHQLDPVYAAQRNTFWCWAAVISMLFHHHGYDIPQEALVAQTFGQVVDMPGQGWQLTQRLNQDYVDARGRRFAARARIFDAHQGQAGLSPNDIVAELIQNRPLVYGAQSHAVLLTHVRYRHFANGAVQILSGTVRDPWPTSGGRRELTWQEMFPTYVAAVYVHGEGR